MALARRILSIALPASLLLLTACGGSEGGGAADGNAPSSNATAASPTGDSSALHAYLGDSICDVLPKSALESGFGATGELSITPHVMRRMSSCSYSWPRPDAEARKQEMVKQMLANAGAKPGERPKLDLRKLSTSYSVSISLTETRASAATFVPPKLSEAELQQRIQQAAEAANKRLTDEQRKLIGKDGAEDLAGGMLRKVNERVEIDGVGDAAYWVPVMGGSLNVLVGDVQVSISPMLADDETANIEAAKKVFGALAL